MAGKNSLDKDGDKLKLKVDAHVVRQLGEELITDPEQALLELIKNSYDADADWCHIEIDTKFIEKDKPKDKNSCCGKITITDNGTGMGRQQIDRGWLTISHSNKRSLKLEGKQSKKHSRNYTGDKGLGRLGSMKLANIIRITSHDKPDTQGISVEFDWNNFSSGKVLSDIPIKEGKIEKKTSTGTVLELIGLTNPDYWAGQHNHKKLQSKLSSLVSPFGHLIDFKVLLTIDDIDIDIEQFSEDIKQQSIAKFSLKLVDGKLFLNGAVKLSFFKGKNSKDQSAFKKFINPDKGLGLFDTLKKKKNLIPHNLAFDEKHLYPFQFSQELNWEGITSTNEIANPGNFTSEIYYYYIEKKEDFSISGLSQDEAKKYFKENVGIQAFRDGFKAGDDGKKDWLNVADAKRSGEGFYSLRLSNLIGFIELKYDNNPEIKDKSDREGFIENPSYNGLLKAMESLINFADEFLNRSRKESLERSKKLTAIELAKPADYSAEDAIVEISNLTQTATSEISTIQAKSKNTALAISSAEKNVDATLDDLLLDEKTRKEIEGIKDQLLHVSSMVKDYSKSSEAILKRLSLHEFSAEKILERLELFKEQISDFHDHVAIGLSAQGVAHEIYPQLDNINFNIRNIKKRLKALGVDDKTVFRSLIAIEADAKVISQDVSILNPMLRNQRLLNQTIDVYEAMSEYLGFRQNLIKSNNIFVKFPKPNFPLLIKFNKGKFTQIIDNLFRNSVYWLEHHSKHFDFNKEIHIEIENGNLIFWDNGPGVREGIEDLVFEMFVSSKPSELGQGLGLYIIDTILKKINCTIELLPERNDMGRMFKFKVDFEGVKVCD